ncbi:MAG: hypothetical protein PWR01_2774 [Clostridiales bacterium]|nr:hypothetical protein [Clostridiales bacterium]MDN5281701.1 hypothetical protein [Candidatus Ozemobacter sp.]
MIFTRKGSAFVIVVGVLGIILFASTMFISSTIDEGRQTSISVKGLHAASLAEAGLERAMRIITEKINKLDPADLTADSLAVKLRLPASAKSGVTLGLSENLGSDELLELSEDVTSEMIFTKEDLQADDDEKELDSLVAYMTSEGAQEYDVQVKVNVEKAFRIAPGSSYSDFKVPGVDTGWNLRPDVKKFLDGEGYSPLEIGFPTDLTWLSFSIPIKVGSIELVNINVAGIIDALMPEMTIAGEPRGFKELTSLDFFADVLINELLSGGKKRYPIEIRFDAIPIPTDVSSLWPAGVSVSASPDDGKYLEKYGQIKLECEASITYKDGYIAKRRVAAVKDFKVADCEPPAPMYSFFAANLNNDKISFNNYGGTFVVSNYDYGGLWTKIKEVFTPGPTELSDEDLRKREIPGLVRVNYIDTSADGTEPLVCNVGMLGDWGAPSVAGDESGGIVKTLTGIEAFLMITTKTRMALAGGKYNINAQVERRATSTNTSVPSGMTGSSGGSTTTDASSAGVVKNNYGLSFANNLKKDNKSAKQYLNQLMAAKSLNVVPDIGGMSTNVLALAVTMALKPMVDAVVPPGIAMVPDAFEKWEMPYMGTSNWLYTIPTTGTGANKTHFFGYGGLYPTLTKEVEGNVLKKYRQWKMCIVGLNPMDRLPLLPFPPVFLPPPPLVIPIWYTHEVLTKYDYNLPPLKANNESGDADLKTYEYDPSKLENMPPNLYTLEQYAKKATYYYEDYQAFLDDIPNRFTTIDGRKVFLLNGVTYVSGSIGEASAPFNPPDFGGEFNVCGKGMIVCSGNFYLGCNIKTLDLAADNLTVFTLMVRSGGLLVLDGGVQREIEGSVYTDKGLYVHSDSSMHFVGNWVTNQFNKAAMGGTVVVDYVSSRVRSSLASLHPVRGKYDPKRYHVSFSPLWSSWRSF